MKKILFTLLVVLYGIPACAVDNMQQIQKAQDVKGAIVVNKQPLQKDATQFQEVTKIYGSIVILWQGTSPADKNNAKNKK